MTLRPVWEGSDSVLSFRAGADLGFQASCTHSKEKKKKETHRHLIGDLQFRRQHVC